MSMTSVLAEVAPGIGLAPAIPAVPRSTSLRERLSARPFLMAPMAGVSDAAYRCLARAAGAGLAYSEMVSVAGLHYASEKTWQLVEPCDAEPDVAVQLFGHEPEQFREAAEVVCERVGDKLALIDINMACPVPKVTRKGEGSALLSDPDRAVEILRATVAGANCPVTVKIRSGRTPDAIVAPDFARAMADAGAQAVAVHGRTASQMYRGSSDPSIIKAVVDAVDVPVIASGDAFGDDGVSQLLESTGAAAVFIARGTYGDPWIFSRALARRDGELIDPPSPALRVDGLVAHVRLLRESGAHMARARSLAAWYLKGLPHAGEWRDRAMRCQTVEDYVELAGNAKQALANADLQ